MFIMTKEEVRKFINDNNSKIISYAIKMGYYDIEEYERLARIAHSIRIIFDSSNSDIYGYYNGGDYSITLNNEQFRDELEVLIYYSHELFHAFDDNKKTMGYQVNGGNHYIHDGVGINEGVTQRKAENVAKKIVGVEPKYSEEESIGVKIVTDLDEYEIEDRMSCLLAKAMGVSYEDFIKMRSLSTAAKKSGDISGTTSLFDEIRHLIDEIYGYRESTWFDKDTYMNRIDSFYEKHGYHRLDYGDIDLGDLGWDASDMSNSLTYINADGNAVFETAFASDVKENIIDAEKAMLKLYLKRIYIQSTISSYEEFVAKANDFANDFIIPVDIDYKAMYDSVVSESEYELYDLNKNEKSSKKVFDIYQYQHDIVLSKIKNIKSLVNYRIINIILESHELDRIITEHDYNEENLIELIEKDSDSLLQDGNLLDLYVREGNEYYKLTISLKHDENGNLDCDIIGKKKVDANDVIDATLNNMCNGNQEEFISVFRDVDRPCEEKRAIIRKERYNKRLFEHENLYEALDERDESKKVEEKLSLADELSMIAAEIDSPFTDSDPFSGLKM